MPVGMTVPGALPLSNAVTLGGVAFPAMAPVISGTLLTNPLAASAQLPQHAAAAAVAAQKLNQVSVRLLISYGVYHVCWCSFLLKTAMSSFYCFGFGEGECVVVT